MLYTVKIRRVGVLKLNARRARMGTCLNMIEFNVYVLQSYIKIICIEGPTKNMNRTKLIRKKETFKPSMYA